MSDMRFAAVCFVSVLVSLSALACATSADDAEESAGAYGTRSGTCQVTFNWYQKDAYRNFASPNRKPTDLWPPHTTTEIKLACNGHTTTKVQTNHGSAPDQRDAHGDLLLQLVKSETVDVPANLAADVTARYQACECDMGEGATKFASLDDLKGDQGKKILANVVDYLKQNFTCPRDANALEGAEQAIAKADFEGAKTEIAGLIAAKDCAWKDGSSFEVGFAKAASSVLAQTSATLEELHVCNNDARLQARFFASLRNATSKSFALGSCDEAAKAALCHEPSWYYNPLAE